MIFGSPFEFDAAFVIRQEGQAARLMVGRHHDERVFVRLRIIERDRDGLVEGDETLLNIFIIVSVRRRVRALVLDEQKKSVRVLTEPVDRPLREEGQGSGRCVEIMFLLGECDEDP